MYHKTVGSFCATWMAICLAAVSSLSCATPGVLNYQAKFVDDTGRPITTPATITFTFWDASSGGNQVWSDFSDTDFVSPSPQGVFSTDIGDIPANPIPSVVFSGTSVWLNVNFNGTDVTPRTQVAAAGIALNALPLYGEAYVVVEAGPDQVTNGNNLIAAYSRAKALTPHSETLSTTNRVTLLVPPGKYNMTTKSLNMDHEYVDLSGISANKADQYIYGSTNGVATSVVHKTANDVRISNLTIECTLTTGVLPNNSGDPAAYYPGGSSAGTEIRNCEFRATQENFSRSMQINVKYLGTYIDCVAGKYSFGGYPTGEAAGNFYNCTGGDYSFGGNPGGMSTGNFVNCTGGFASFGGSGATASGTYTGCTGDYGSFGGIGGTASGTFRDCAGGFGSFGGGGTASGLFVGCVGADDSFGTDGDTSGTFVNCIGGNYSFGGFTLGAVGGSATGHFINCSAGFVSFGGATFGLSFTPVVSGTFDNCVGGLQSFGKYCNVNGAKFHYCSGGASSYDGTGSATYLYCIRDNAAYP